MSPKQSKFKNKTLANAKMMKIFFSYRHKIQSVRTQTSIIFQTAHRHRIRTILIVSLQPTVRMSRDVSDKMLRDRITFFSSLSSILFIPSMWWVDFTFVKLFRSEQLISTLRRMSDCFEGKMASFYSPKRLKW